MIAFGLGRCGRRWFTVEFVSSIDRVARALEHRSADSRRSRRCDRACRGWRDRTSTWWWRRIEASGGRPARRFGSPGSAGKIYLWWFWIPAAAISQLKICRWHLQSCASCSQLRLKLWDWYCRSRCHPLVHGSAIRDAASFFDRLCIPGGSPTNTTTNTPLTSLAHSAILWTVPAHWCLTQFLPRVN